MYEFSWWWMFFLLPLPWLVRWLLKPAEQSGVALRVPFLQDFLQQGVVKGQSLLTRLALLCAALAWIGLLTAVARPVWVGDAVALPAAGRDLMLAVDLSGSMQEQDFRINQQVVDRLAATKLVASEFISQRTGDRVGWCCSGIRPICRPR